MAMMYCSSASTRHSHDSCGPYVRYYPIALLIAALLAPVSIPSLSESVCSEATHLQSGVSGANQEKRVALVIGNSAYQEASALPNVLNDRAVELLKVSL
jgi:hypothetical protein